ncbi:serine/threonine-protein kinase [Actinoplanes sp. NPDC049681]|uniref:serine/threonine-protein kinase n=1 Tax=Actinoplanes sp. NPDC049681 TaxID=3363905 RepID=UPI00378B98AE
MIAPQQIGPYRVERLLGTGSFATVWLGHHASLGARVAIKVLAENWSHDLRVRERFQEEARLLWRLDHERVVRVHSLGELPDGRPYLVMTWADGGSLRDRLAEGPVPVGSGLRLLQDIAAGVGVLHENGIVHRDLTPGNILFRSGPAGGERVLIADLGLAKALAAASGLTARAGTPGYMAPEQDDPLSIVDTRTDVYALGRLGERLLAARTDVPRSQVRLRAGVPVGVADVLRTATAHRPGDRFRDAAQFAAALGRATTADDRSRSLRRRRPLVAAGLLLGAALTVTTLGADAAGGRFPASASDTTGRITVALPPGWRGDGQGWEGQRDADGRRDPALVISPAPGRWLSDPKVPGAFIGVSRGLGRTDTPAAFVAGRRHARCTADPVRTSRAAGVDWVVARHASCEAGKPVIVEAAGVVPGGEGLVYVQIAPPASSPAAFVDALLAGIEVH